MEFEINRKASVEKNERIKFMDNYIIEYTKIIDKLRFLVDQLDVFGEGDEKLNYIASGYIKFYEDCINKLTKAKKEGKFSIDPESECIPTTNFFVNYLKNSLLKEECIEIVNDENTRNLLRMFKNKLAKYNDGKIKASPKVKERRIDQVDKEGYLIPNPDGLKLTNKFCHASKRNNENCLKVLDINSSVNLPKIFPVEETELLLLNESEYKKYAFYLSLIWSIILIPIIIAIPYPQNNFLTVFLTIFVVFLFIKYVLGDFKNLEDGNCMTFGKVAYWSFIKPLSLFKKGFRILAKYKRNLILYVDKDKNKHISYFHVYCPYCLNVGDKSELHLVNQKNGIIAVCKDAPKIHRYKFDHKRKVIIPL